VLSLPLPELLARAAAVRDERYGCVSTFSPKIFLPLTHLCRDSCAYCAFAQPPRAGQRCYMTLAQVLQSARAGAAAGCTEALFTLGDAPELRYAAAAAELAELGFESTADYLAEAAAAVLRETGLLPHLNAGVLSAAQFRRLRACSVSQGLMLEGLAPSLAAPGGPHHGCVTKTAQARLAALEAAGEARVPFTSGLLIGIGETRAERVAALAALRDSHARHGHLGEVIIQNFRAKPGTRMAAAAEPSEEELLWTVAAARLLLPPAVSLQAPPNLQRGGGAAWRALLRAGINDWGGVSPVTPDFVNPEAAWPHLAELADACAAEGFSLAPRLPVYPGHLQAPAGAWLDAAPLRAALAHADAAGLGRGHPFVTGQREGAPGAVPLLPSAAVAPASGAAAGGLRPRLAALLARCADAAALAAEPLSELETALLLSARGAEVEAVCAAADAVRRSVCGDVVSYVVTRNINYTNVCTFACSFCAFSKGAADDGARGAAYLLPPEEVGARAAEAWARGATEACMQGGIHPSFGGDTYVTYLEAAKRAAPRLHVHAFSPLEVWEGARRSGASLEAYLGRLRDAGLGSLPGTAAEVLDDGLRATLCPDKLSSGQWAEVVGAAHAVGLRTTSTLMFGHIERGYSAWAAHLGIIRRLALAHPGAITEFVPLPFVAAQAPLYLRGAARRGPSLRECLLVHAAARLALHGAVDNIQASWVKMGPDRAAALLAAGCNDMGGTLMNESITRAAGAQHGQELPPAEMEALIRAAGRTPRQRTTLYGAAPEEQVRRSMEPPPLAPLRNAPAWAAR